MADQVNNEKDKVDAYNSEAKKSRYSSYRFAGENGGAGRASSPNAGDLKGRKPAKAPISKKRKIGAAVAIILGLCFTGAVLTTSALAVKNAVGAVSRGEIEELPELPDIADLPFNGGAEELPDEGSRPEFDEPAGVPDLPKDETDDKSGATASVSGEDMTVADVAEYCMPSMVVITTTTVQEMQSFFGNGTETYEGEASGTGIIIEKTAENLLVVTNNHVIADSETISIGFVDDTVVPAEILGRDTAEDLAVLAISLNDIPAETLDAISVIEMGDSDDCRVGEPVVAIGNALGYGQSVSTGIISALEREVVVDNVRHTLIQTDAAINPGNSGGALLNMRGQLIGINEVKYAETTVEGMGYAIPIAKARPIIDHLMNREVRDKVPEDQRSYLGVTCVTIPESYVSQGYPSGVYISEVIDGQAASAAGIQTGDIISAIDGYSVTTAEELVNELEYYSEGTTVTLTVLRLEEDNQEGGFKSTSVDVTLGSRKDAPVETEPEESEGAAQQPEQLPQAPGGDGGQESFPFEDWQQFFEFPFFR